MWNDLNRTSLLNNNQTFLKNYCSKQTKNVLSTNGIISQDGTVLNEAFITKFREIVIELTKLMPNAAHSSPKWDKTPQPLLRIGKNQITDKGNTIKIIHEPIGLCVEDGKIYIFFESTYLDKNINSFPLNLGWSEWRNEQYKRHNDEITIENLQNTFRQVLTNHNNGYLNQFDLIYPKYIEDYAIKKITEITTKSIGLNTILYGPPGTGKTFNTINVSLQIIEASVLEKQNNESDGEYRKRLKDDFDKLVNKNQISFLTFHQSFSYEEFVEGIRAETKDEKISYFIKNGIFKQLCENAKKDSENNYVLIIDEINRGNISKIFGELITLIEDSKRAGNDEELTVTLPYSGKPFSVPNNLYIIGTMNTADRSLALMDTALRRRFDFIEMPPKPKLLKDIFVGKIDIEKMLTTMNKRITVLYDREHTLGHAFFMPLKENLNIETLANIFENKILPLLQEYFFDDWEKIRKVLGDNKKAVENQFIKKETIDSDLLEQDDFDENPVIYEINKEALLEINTYTGIYK